MPVWAAQQPLSLPGRAGAAAGQTQPGATPMQPLLLAATEGLCSHFHGLGRNKSCTGGRCGGKELQSSWCRERGYGRSSCWRDRGVRSGQVSCRPCCSMGLPGPWQSPCQGSLWHQRRRLPLLPIPVDVLALPGAGASLPSGVGCSLGCPWAVPQCSPQVLPCRLLGIWRGRGNLAWGRQGATVRAGAGPAAPC